MKHDARGSVPLTGTRLSDGLNGMQEKYWYIKRCELFRLLTPDQVTRLEASSQMRQFDRKSLIYLPSEHEDAVLLVVKGRIRLYHLTGEGKEAVLAFIDPGEIFGETVLLNQPGGREEFAEAMEATTLLKIPGPEIRGLMQQFPDLCFAVTKLMGFRRQRVERRLKSLLFRSNRERLSHLLLELMEQYGEPEGDNVRLRIKLSHQELANIIGSTRETVTVLLGELQNDRLIEIRRRQILLLNPGSLADAVGIPVPNLRP